MAFSSRILIVENNSLFRASLCQQLALEGFKNVMEVGLFANLDDILRDLSPDLVLLIFKCLMGTVLIFVENYAVMVFSNQSLC